MDYLDLLALEKSLLEAEDVSHLITKLRAHAALVSLYPLLPVPSSTTTIPRLDVPADYAAGMAAGFVVAANVLTEMFGRAKNKPGTSDASFMEIAKSR